jgi:hypothetical protein
MTSCYDKDYDELWTEHAEKLGMFPKNQEKEYWGIVQTDDWLRGLLIFDRIWIPWWISPPSPISDKGSFCDYTTDLKVMDCQLGQRMNELKVMGRESENLDFSNENTAKKALNKLLKDGLKRSIRYVAELYSQKGYDVIPLYGKSQQFQNEYTPGLQIAYEASLNEISVVSPEHLTVEQVFDFREDIEAAKQYRSLRLWLRDGLKAESVNHATDIISQKLEAYEWAIKKHGLKTVTGAFSSILSNKTLIAIASGASLATLLSGSVWSALIGGGLIACSRSLIWIAERQIDFEDVKRGENSEVALFYTMKRFLTD